MAIVVFTMRCSASSGATKGSELTYAWSKAPFVITGAFDTHVECHGSSSFSM
mgnify:CR=1 FL=1